MDPETWHLVASCCGPWRQGQRRGAPRDAGERVATSCHAFQTTIEITVDDGAIRGMMRVLDNVIISKCNHGALAGVDVT